MFKRREFACFDAVEAAVECVCRGTVLLQNMVEYSSREDVDETLRRLQGVSAAAHRGWRELNGRLARTFLSSMEREDISAFVRELAELCDALWRTAVLWGGSPLDSAAAWGALLAEGGRLLRELCEQLPLFGQENDLSDRAEELYALRREADRLWAGERRCQRGRVPAAVGAFHDTCVQFARVADTAEWLVLKNT